MKFLMVLWFFFGLTYMYCQDVHEYKNKYPGSHELILKDKQSYRFEIKKSKPHIISDYHYESIILSEAGVQNTSENFSYSELVPLRSFDAYTLVQEKGKEKKIAVNQATDKSSNSSSIFHSDLKEKKLVFNKLEVGAKKVYTHQTEFLDHHLLHKFSFAGYLPIDEAELEVSVDKDLVIDFKIFNDDKQEIVLKKVEKKDKTVYVWKRMNIKGMRQEKNHPGFLHVAPHIVIYLKSYKSSNNVVPVLGTTDLLYGYYKTFTNDLNKDPNDELRTTTLQITDGTSDIEQKIKNIFYWVKDNIKYVAFEHSYEGFIPRNASLVFERRFGDCKDMSSIITEMAKYAGIPDVNLCWIGTRNLPYSYSDVSTPAACDHMIASIVLDDRHIFLDATDKAGKFGLPTGFIQGKEAMIQDGESYKIVNVPIVKPKDNYQKDSVIFYLDHHKLTGEGYLELSGMSRSDFINYLGDASKIKRMDIIKNLVLKGNNKFILNNYSESNISDRDLPYQVGYFFDLENYVVHVGNEYFLSMFLEKPLDQNIIEDNREAKYSFNFLSFKKYIFELVLPNGAEIKNLPKNVAVDNELLQYKIEYTQKENKLILNFEIENKKLVLEAKDFSLWNSTLKELKSSYNENITIKIN